MKFRMSTAADYLLDLIFPNRCPCCGCFIEWNKLICSECEEKLSALEYCGEGKNSATDKTFYDKIYAAYFYKEAAKNGVLAMKESRSTNFGKLAAIRLAELMRRDEIKADFIVPVPMSARKRRQRGYNQAMLIATEVGRALDIPVNGRLLHNKGGKAEQHMLSASERKENVSRFWVSELKLENKRIILCDDVITTGSTANRCAELLKSVGVKKVYVACATGTSRGEK